MSTNNKSRFFWDALTAISPTRMDANNTNSTTEIDFQTLSKIIDYTSYFFYTSIFLFGITGNSVVIYVLLSPICCGSKSNRDHFGYNAAPTSHFYNSPVAKRKSSFRTKSTSTLRRSKAFNNNEEITAVDKNVNFWYVLQIRKVKNLPLH